MLRYGFARNAESRIMRRWRLTYLLAGLFRALLKHSPPIWPNCFSINAALAREQFLTILRNAISITCRKPLTTSLRSASIQSRVRLIDIDWKRVYFMPLTLLTLLTGLSLLAGIHGGFQERPALHGVVVNEAGMPAQHATVLIFHAGPKHGYSVFCPSCYSDCGKRIDGRSRYDQASRMHDSSSSGVGGFRRSGGYSGLSIAGRCPDQERRPSCQRT